MICLLSVLASLSNIFGHLEIGLYQQMATVWIGVLGGCGCSSSLWIYETACLISIFWIDLFPFINEYTSNFYWYHFYLVKTTSHDHNYYNSFYSENQSQLKYIPKPLNMIQSKLCILWLYIKWSKDDYGMC